ncbi:MAG: HD domain-containing protein [Candidatus Woesearchaeota archaeon]
MDLILKAFSKAYELHNGQRRKASGAPYFVHLLDAAKYLMYETDDVEVICAGILHDTLEDTNYSESELRADFGDRVFKLVKFCTESKNNVNFSKSDLKMSWFERKRGAIAKLEGASSDELLVFCADKVSTLLSIKEDLDSGIDVWSSLNGSYDNIKWYYSEIERVLKSKLEGKRIFSVYQDLMFLFVEKKIEKKIFK